ncbi:leucine-rich repeat-containing protein 28-like isoform X1 [Schistocerca gregaria]|uniref:leucine-rich repeat-containing protein 28-like isoform X1 n=1 Tax=Schistocerca gregaria TaxID=7010 RepID=UPI00211DAC7E|nr:leucine-rich repeat-containing protein 28-like isoform X1 [Schistocerca gregaria]
MDCQLLGEVCQKTILHWNYRDFDKFPDELHYAECLTDLYLKENHITTLPTWIGSLKQLTGLYLFQNKLNFLPHEIGDLCSLTVLDVAHNFLSVLPESLCKLSNLQELSLSRNRLAYLPKEKSWKLSQLTRLPANQNQWRVFLKLVLQYQRCLRIMMTMGKEKGLGQLTSLRCLLVDGNHLSYLPNSIGQLSQLQCLNVSSNFLKWLPMVTLPAGCELDVSNNTTLTFLPAEMLPLLPRIKLDGCCQEWRYVLTGPRLLILQQNSRFASMSLPLPAPMLGCCRCQCSHPQAPPLQELCLRKLHSVFTDVEGSRLTEPAALCARCGVPVYLVGAARIWLCSDVEPLLVMELHCSVYCARSCSAILTPELNFQCCTYTGYPKNCDCFSRNTMQHF